MDGLAVSNIPASLGRTYTAFLSYRHADNQENGRRWAEWLHHVIETYEIPPDLVGTKNLDGEPIPASLYPVFRDEEELPADADLPGNILRALRNSRSLVVLCSPRACGSPFVAEEIRQFKELGRGTRILAFLLDGEPNASDRAAGDEEPPLECLPRELRYGVVGNDGKIDWQRRCPLLIAADSRPEGKPMQGYTTSGAWRMALEKGGMEHGDARRQAAEYEKRLEQARFKILAGLLRVQPSQLEDRDAVYRLRKARQQRLIAFAVAIFAVALSLFAWRQQRIAQSERNNADQQRDVATGQRKEAIRQRQTAVDRLKAASRTSFAVAQENFEQGHWAHGTAYLGASLRDDPDNRLAADALWLALMCGDRDDGKLPIRTLRHSAKVTSAEFCLQGQAVVTTCEDHAARIWNIDRGDNEEPLVLNHPDTVTFASVSPDGRAVVTVCGRTTQLWDARTGGPLGAPLQDNDPVQEAVFSPDSRYLVTCGGSDKEGAKRGFACVWNILDRKRVGQPMVHDGLVEHVRYSPDGIKLVTFGLWNKAQVWKASTQHRLAILAEKEPYAESIGAAFSPDSQWIATGEGEVNTEGPSNRVRVWNATTGQLRWRSPTNTYTFGSVCFSPDGASVVSSNEDGAVQVWNAKTGQPHGNPLKHDTFAFDARYSPDGTHVLTASGGYFEPGCAQLWDVMSGKKIGEPLRHSGWLEAAKFDPSGTRILTVGDDNAVRVWDAATRKPSGIVFDHQGKVSMVAFTADGKQLLTRADPEFFLVATPSNPILLYLWDLETGNLVRGTAEETPDVWGASTLEKVTHYPVVERLGDGNVHLSDFITTSPAASAYDSKLFHGDNLDGVRCSPNADLLALVSKKHGITLLDYRKHTLTTRSLPDAKEVRALCFSPDESRLVTMGESGLVIWDTASGLQVGTTIEYKTLDEFRFRVGSPLVDLVSSRSACVIDTTSGAMTVPPWDVPMKPGDNGISAFMVSGNGHLIAFGCSDTTALVFSTDKSRALVASLPHPRPVEGVTFDASGARLASVDELGDMRVWDISRSQQVGPQIRTSERSQSLVFSDDGSRIASHYNQNPIARVVFTQPRQLLHDASLAEAIAQFSSGFRIESRTGVLLEIPADDRHRLWESLRPRLEKAG